MTIGQISERLTWWVFMVLLSHNSFASTANFVHWQCLLRFIRFEILINFVTMLGMIIVGVLNYQMAASCFVKCLFGSGKYNRRILDWKGWESCPKISRTLQNKGDEGFCGFNSKSLLKLLAYLDTGNQHNWNKMWAVLPLFTEFLTEFKSIWVIMLKQLFTEGKGKIDV